MVSNTFRTLTNRNDMTGAERTWAARYKVGNVLQYTTSSKAEGIVKDSYAIVRSVDATANRLTVELENGKTVSYDPKRLRGVTPTGKRQGVRRWQAQRPPQRENLARVTGAALASKAYCC